MTLKPPASRLMPRVLLASLAAAFAAPAHAVPMAFMDDVLAGFTVTVDEPLVIEKDVIIAAADEARAHADAMRRWADEFSAETRANLMTTYGPRMGSSRLVKGAPYSAEVITENNQSLADGNVITKKTQGAVFRDGEGRTRQESGGDGRRKATIYISDPVESKHIVLMPDTKKAIVTSRGGPLVLHESGERSREKSRDKAKETKDKRVMRFGANEIRIEDGKVYLDGKEASDGKVELRTAAGKDVRVENGKVFIDGKEITAGSGRVVMRSVDEKETGDGTRREEIRIQVVHAGDRDVAIAPIPPIPPIPPMPHMDGTPLVVPPVPPLPGVQTLRFESTARLGKGVTTQLGMKDFDGVRAEGKSTVWTIPAGEIGNRNPIQVTSETWYAPDLKVMVYSRYNDPRTGESIYRLANIRRAEPSKDLFAVPEGYETKGRK